MNFEATGRKRSVRCPGGGFEDDGDVEDGSLIQRLRAGAKLAAIGKRDGGMSFTISSAGRSVTLTASDAIRLRVEAAAIRERCTHKR